MAVRYESAKTGAPILAEAPALHSLQVSRWVDNDGLRAVDLPVDGLEGSLKVQAPVEKVRLVLQPGQMNLYDNVATTASLIITKFSFLTTFTHRMG